MFIVDEKKQKISMTEGDYGVVLPLTIELENGETLGAEDKFLFKIYEKIDTDPIITQEYDNIEDNIIPFKLSKEESSRLIKGKIYYYDIDWYIENEMNENIIGKKKFKIIDKAGAVNEN